MCASPFRGAYVATLKTSYKVGCECRLTSNCLGILAINGRAHCAQLNSNTQCMAKDDDRYDQEGEQTNVKQTRNAYNNRIENSEFVYDDRGRAFIVTAVVSR